MLWEENSTENPVTRKSGGKYRDAALEMDTEFEDGYVKVCISEVIIGMAKMKIF